MKLVPRVVLLTVVVAANRALLLRTRGAALQVT